MTPAIPPDLDVSRWPLIPQRPNRDSRTPRRYKLTPAGLAALQDAAARVCPWTRSTGPRTPAGKAVSRYNRLVHGRRSAEAVDRRGRMTAAMRWAGRLLKDQDRVDVALWTLLDLSRLLAVDEDQLGKMDEAAFDTAAGLVGVDPVAVSGWLNRRLAAKTLAAALRIKPPKSKPPKRPLAVTICWADGSPFPG